MIDTNSVGVEIRTDDAVAVAVRRRRVIVLQAAEAPAPAHCSLGTDLVRELHVTAVGRSRFSTDGSSPGLLKAREQQRRAEAFADVATDYDRQVRHAGLDPGRTTDRADRLAARCRIGRRLPEPADPEHVAVPAGLLVVGELAFHPRNPGELVGAAPQNARLEQTDGELRLARLGAVGDLRVKVRIEVSVP